MKYLVWLLLSLLAAYAIFLFFAWGIPDWVIMHL